MRFTVFICLARINCSLGRVKPVDLGRIAQSLFFRNEMKPIVTATTTTSTILTTMLTSTVMRNKTMLMNAIGADILTNEKEAYLNVKWVNVSDDAGDDDDDLSVIVGMRHVTLELFCSPPHLRLSHKWTVFESWPIEFD